MIRSVLSSPREIPALIRTALDARAARATLIRGRKLLDPTFKTSAKANEPVLVKARPKAIVRSGRYA
jgi:hypothetical protein